MRPAGLDKVQNQELRDFIMLCIQHNPEARPEARKLLKHPFFESIRAGTASNDRPQLLERPSEELQVSSLHMLVMLMLLERC